MRREQILLIQAPYGGSKPPPYLPAPGNHTVGNGRTVPKSSSKCTGGRGNPPLQRVVEDADPYTKLKFVILNAVKNLKKRKIQNGWNEILRLSPQNDNTTDCSNI